MTALLLAVALAQPAFAGADPAAPGPEPMPAGSPVVADGQGAKKATQALEVAESALSGESDLDPTMALLQVKQSLDDLPDEGRKRAAQLLARPTDPEHRDWEISYEGKKSKRHCSAHFCVHWVPTGHHAPSPRDQDGDNVPDYVESVTTVMEHIWGREVGEMLYKRPLSDGKKGYPAGPSGLVDVYLGDTGARGIYGYATSDVNRATAPAYLVLDNDFADFPGKPGQLLRVTAAHEFFHAIQFAYAGTEDGWLMESTATWMEERVYDDINDNRQYLATSSLKTPQLPLDHPYNWYGNWIFFEHLSTTHGNKVVREIWDRAAKPSVNSMQAIDQALRVHRTTLRTAFSRFSADSNVPERAYAEGAAYRPAKVSASWSLGKKTKAQRTTGSHTVKLLHMSSRNYTFTPRRSTNARWRLRIKVTAPSHNARAYALVHLRSGKLLRHPISLNHAGNGALRLRFTKKRVAGVTLNLANSSFRFRCYRNTSYTCAGKPLDDRRAFTFRADLGRR